MVKILKEFKGISNIEGKFNIKIDAGDTYNIKLKSIGEAKEYNTLKIPSIEEGQYFQPSSMFIKIEPATNFELKNVFFESGRADIKPSSLLEIKELYTFLSLKKSIKIEISGHTDNIGNEEDNKRLSQQRAENVKNILVSKGIDPNRIVAIGYGEDKPRDTNSTEEGRQNNRRTEVKIL